MALTRVTIPVPDIETVIESYEYILVYRSETKYGTYTEITDSATRIDLIEDQCFYDYDDETGSEFYWYKWCYYEDTEALSSKFYGPIQGSTPGTTYCQFDSVERELRSNKQVGRIRFSGSYKNLRHSKNTAGTINLKEVTLNPEYCGRERFKITFTDEDDFTVTVGEEPSIEPRNIGSGKNSADFISDDNMLRIQHDSWTGTAANGSIVEFETDSHMSTMDAIKFIQDSEILVDMIIERNLTFTEEKRYDLRFTREDVPKAIGIATAKFAAFFIYSSIYNEQAQTGIPTNLNDITAGSRRPDDFSSWPRQAMFYLDAFVKKYTEKFNINTGNPVTTGPRWRGHGNLFDAGGVAYVGDGLMLPEIDAFREAASMTYDNLLDWDLMIPYIGSYESVTY